MRVDYDCTLHINRMHRTISFHVRKASLLCMPRLAALRLRTITHSSTPIGSWKPKEEGSIASVFSSISGSDPALPTRFSALKKEIWRESLTQSWRDVLDELKASIEEVATKGADVLKSAFTPPAADADILVDDTVHTILGPAERIINRSNLRNPERRCLDCPRRRTKRGLMFFMSPSVLQIDYYLLTNFLSLLGSSRLETVVERLYFIK